MNTRALGIEAENEALKYLERQGLDLITRNFSCRRGEIDLIMRDADCIVFVEVRMRNNPNHGSGADTVTRSKMRKLALTAEVFLNSKGNPGNLDCRFDVISVDDKIDWIQHAFTLDSL